MEEKQAWHTASTATSGNATVPLPVAARLHTCRRLADQHGRDRRLPQSLRASCTVHSVRGAGKRAFKADAATRARCTS